MSILIDKRKRSREGDVVCESTPLSKRINNLHLSNFEEMNYHQLEQSLYGIQQQQRQQQCYTDSQQIQQLNDDSNSNQCLAKSTVYSPQSQECMEILGKINTITLSHNSNGMETDDKVSYNPELNETENPFYYIKNKLLYELHLERLKRTNM